MPEPPVRVGNGSVTVKIDSAEAGVEWVHQAAAQWIRRGPPSDAQGGTWIIVNDAPVLPVTVEVRVRTSDGDLFFSYRNGRTFLDTSVRLVRRDSDRKLLSTPVTQIFDVAVRSGPSIADGEEWNLVDLSTQRRE